MNESILNKPPEIDEVEISLLGSGYGECIVIHFGFGEWGIVDSCQFANSKRPAALEYLTELGVSSESAVKIVVATHWDDDHIRGLGKIVENCTQSSFAMSAAIEDKRFRRIVLDSPLATAEKLGQSVCSGVREFNTIYHALKDTGRLPDYALNNKRLWRSETASGAVFTALSPHSEVFEDAIKAIIAKLPSTGEPIGSINAPHPNFTAVVLWLEIGDIAVLLGADMEESLRYKGWSLITNDTLSRNQKANLFKVAHHGSANADHDDIWEKMLKEDPVCLIAPWTLGGKRLPKPKDIQRICSRSSEVHISQVETRSPKVKVTKNLYRNAMMRRNKVRPLLSSRSMIRCRRKLGTADWCVEHFGNATRY